MEQERKSKVRKVAAVESVHVLCILNTTMHTVIHMYIRTYVHTLVLSQRVNELEQNKLIYSNI